MVRCLLRAFGWLYENHPRTAIQNLDMLVRRVCKTKKGAHASHGYWKDLTNIVALAAVSELGPLSRRPSFLYTERTRRSPNNSLTRRFARHPAQQDEKVKRTPDESIAAAAREKAEARDRRVTKNAELHSILLQQLSNPRFRALYIAVARLFAERLVEDMHLADKADAMQDGPERTAVLRQISLAGKWAPTPRGAHDRVTNLATAISLLVIHSLPHASSLSISPDTPNSPLDTHILRSYYQRHVLTRLRKISACPESFMSQNRWSEITYNRVPTQCMKRNLAKFFIHDPTRFEQYIADVENGKMSGTALMPHKLLTAAMKCECYFDGPRHPLSLRLDYYLLSNTCERLIAEIRYRGIEAQWKAMVERVREAGTLDNCLAVCDVSGLMTTLVGERGGREPATPAIALTLVIASLASPPFENKFITFSAEPEFVQVNPAHTLIEKANAMKSVDFGASIFFERIFLGLILPLAIENNLKQEDMVKRLFVFTDKRFDAVRGGSAAKWEKSHKCIERQFKEAGYELPEIVFWDLSHRASINPVTYDRRGVVFMNGLSAAKMKAFMKVFMGDEAEEIGDGPDMAKPIEMRQKEPFDSPKFMHWTVSNKSFDGLVIVD